MKRTIVMLSVAVFVIATIAAVSLHTQGYTYDTLEKLFNRMVESSADDNSIKVEFVNTVSDFSVHNETALTATVDPTFEIRHTTTGTPANGIGLSMGYKQKTSASNEEIIARIAAVTTDVTVASEDAKIDFMTMAGGAAAATTLSLGSTGIVTMAGSATLDNTTSATNLAIAETNIGLTGNLTITGATTVTGTLVHGEWDVYEYLPVTAASYTLASIGRAGVISLGASVKTFHFDTELLTSPGAGGIWTVVLLGTNDVVFDTEGAETINGAATFTMDGSREATTFFTDGTDFFVIGGYLE